MAIESAQAGAELIETVCNRLQERLPADEAPACEEFARQYYRWVPADDLADSDPADLCGAVLAHWKLARHRAAGETRLAVGTPSLEENGWRSAHSVVEIVSDDMPFLVDSVVMELTRQGYGTHLVIHPVIRVQRDADGALLTVAHAGADAPGTEAESVIHVEFDREPDPIRANELKRDIERVLNDVRASVEDWQAMQTLALGFVDRAGEGSTQIGPHDLREARAFLRWLTDDRFVFLGYRQYDLTVDGDAGQLQAVPGSGLGILRGEPGSGPRQLGERALALALEPASLIISHANSRSTVHRPAYLDYVGVRRFGPSGETVGEDRFLGLYTTTAHRDSPLEIPLVRDKVNYVLDRAGFPPHSHDAKALIAICESYPRDSLLQLDADELLRSTTGILALGERQRVRLFTHVDALGRFVNCLVCLPRDRVTTESRDRISQILLEAFDGSQFDWDVQRTESTVSRMRFVIHTGGEVPAVDEGELEQKIAAVIRSWNDDLREALVEDHRERVGLALYRRFESAFPPAYRADLPADGAVQDIALIERLREEEGPILRLYRESGRSSGGVRCRLFSREPISLSDVLPKFERMGVPVSDERPYEIKPIGDAPVWLYDFGLGREVTDLDAVHELFEQAFLGVWHGALENDQLGALVLGAGLSGERIVILRALTRYLHQAWGAFTDRFMEAALVQSPEIATLLVELFIARLDPDARDDVRAASLHEQIELGIDSVESLNQDRILRTYLAVVLAILRTNYFTYPRKIGVQRASPPGPGGPGEGPVDRSYLSFKLDPALVGVLPLPLPRFEIFVYSPRIEGVHLRGGKVARGGLRWSDRREDFRTEVLGLMKAQMVKNALIVPVGSKGGFVLKQPPAGGGREALQTEAIACYKTFLRGLLDLTDNIVAGEIVPPARVVRYDEDDPYLVVAADKGTATFSDIANSVSAEYGFWLGDGFASGGSQGYDHKEMAITARGAWESVKRHFRDLGTDIQTTPFTVVGVGDMAGDVFGNGMLLSPQIRLLAAFNHMHVFIDPDPDPAVSLAERQRLFVLPRSAWSDYDHSLISAGGGVFERSAKSIPISPQARAALGIEELELPPDQLISQILKAPVDLLWNGGIGTYVKSWYETQLEVGDRANDGLRIDGRDLRCKVVGEGGNLGFTQLGRIEYALAGGHINTDAIDNVGGVNCSDHEVNIKILLDALVADGDMTVDARNELLVEMTDAVAAQVLRGSYVQTQALSLACLHASMLSEEHARLIRSLERNAGLNREVEFLPSEQEIADRRAAGRGLTAPELAVVMAYCKIDLKSQLLDSDMPEDRYLGHDLERYFPAPLSDRYLVRMHHHRLRREIIATVVANQLVDRAGITFVQRVQEQTGAPASLLARGYAVAREVYGMLGFWADVEALDNKVSARVQLTMLSDARVLVEHATAWLVRAHADDPDVDIAGLVRRYAPGADLLTKDLLELLEGDDAETVRGRETALTDAGVPVELARRAAALPFLLPVFDIVEVAAQTGQELEVVLAASFRIEAAMRQMRNLVPAPAVATASS
jgi:glutamate dehydrogenase